MLEAMESLAKARGSFKESVKQGLILGNDNHIGDIGEYWVRNYFLHQGKFKEYAPKKNAPYDIELIDGCKISVKTITEWSDTGYGTQIKPLCGTKWQVLAAVFLDKKLFASKISLVPVAKLVNFEPFVTNKGNREENGTKAYPRFQWWDWLDEFIV